MIGFLVHLALQVLGMLLPLAVSVVLLRMLAKPILGGHGGVGAEFMFRVFLWPFQVVRWLLRGLWREWRHSHYRHVKIKQRHRRPILATLAERIARRTRQVAGPLFATDDGPYPRDDFDVVWQEHLRKLRRRIEGDR